MLTGKSDEEKQAIVEIAKGVPEFMQLLDIQRRESVKANMLTLSSGLIPMLNTSKNICLSYLAGACKFGVACRSTVFPECTYSLHFSSSSNCRQSHPQNPEEVAKWKAFFAKHPCKWGSNVISEDGQHTAIKKKFFVCSVECAIVVCTLIQTKVSCN